MRRAVETGLQATTGVGGWHIEVVGGSRRQQRPPQRQQEEGGEQAQGQGGEQAREQGSAQQAGQRSEASLLSQPGGRGGNAVSGGGGTSNSTQAGSKAGHHDADFVVTHFSYTWPADLIDWLKNELLEARRIMPADQGAMCMVQVWGGLPFGFEGGLLCCG
jgi:hypothetical protein